MTQRTTLILFLVTLTTAVAVEAQKKSELFAEIEMLKTEKDSISQALAASTRKISAAEAEAESLRSENTTLRDANATLMQNLGNFSELSKKTSQNANNALARLEEREKQLTGINNTFTANDSIAIVLLTKSKQVLGDGAKIGVSGGDIVISYALADLFESDTSTAVTSDASNMLAKVAEVANAAPERVLVVEGMNITGEFDLTFQQVAAVSAALVKSDSIIKPKAIRTMAMDGNFKEGINIRLEPDHEKFYQMVKQDVKK